MSAGRRWRWLALLLGCGARPDEVAVEHWSMRAGDVRLRTLTDADRIEEPETIAGRAGDLLLENDLVAFVLSAGPGEDCGPRAGALLDAYLVERGRRQPFDGVDGIWPLINGAPLDTTTSELSQPDTDTLEIRFSGPQLDTGSTLALAGAEPELGPLLGSVAYRLRSDSRALEILIDAQNTGTEPVQLELGNIATVASDAAEMLTLPPGFDPFSDLDHVDAIGNAADASAWTALLFAEEPLRLVRDVRVVDLLGSNQAGVVRFDVRRAELAPGERTSVRHWFALGRDLAEAAAERLTKLGLPTLEVSGRVRAAGIGVPWARVSFFEDAEATRLVAQTRADAAGAFSAPLSPGNYFVRASGRSNGEHVHVPGLEENVADGFEVQTESTRWLELATTGAQGLELALAPSGKLALELVDEGGRPSAGKLTFQREEALPPPLHSAAERQPYAELGVARVDWTLTGSVDAALPPGRYTVTASRGPQRGLAVAHGVPVEAHGSSLRLRLPPRVGPAGYIAIDSHLHGPNNGHGEVTRAERLITALAEGLDVAVSTDHNQITDYGPLAARLGIADQLLTIPSSELSYTTGHHNPWPLHYDASLPYGGAPCFVASDPGLDALYASYAALGASVFQVNHGVGYFSNAGYDPATGTANVGPGFSFAFNAMELHNAKGAGDRRRLIPIWFSLLNWGHRVAPLAASDSHTRIPEPGTGRSYVWLGEGVKATAESIAQAVLALRTVASTGPLIEFSLADGAPALGRDVRVEPGTFLEVTLRVWAPDWIPIQNVDLFANGNAIGSWSREGSPTVASSVGAEGLWFETRVSLRPERDTWYAVQATGGGDLAPVYPYLATFAMTAPLFVDADEAPGFTPPCQAGACP